MKFATTFLACLAASFVFLPRVQAQVAISEVMWAGSDLSSADEWIELAVSCQCQEVGIAGWRLTYVDSNGTEQTMVTFQSGTVIASDQFFIVSNYNAASSRLLAEPQLANTDIVLPNTKLVLRLYSADGVLVDEVDDGIGEPFAGYSGSEGEAKASMERIDLFRSGTEPLNWQNASIARGFDESTPLLGTPGFPLEVGLPQDSLPPEEARNLTGALLSGALLLRWEPSISSDLSSQLLSLVASQGLPVASIELTPIVDGYRFDGLSDGDYMVTLQMRDGTGNTSEGIQVAFSASVDVLEEVQQTPPAIVISEVLPNPGGSDDGEWIEIANTTSQKLSLEGYSLRIEGSTRVFPLTGELAAEAFRSVRKTETGLQLPNAGGTVQLAFDETLRDTLAYPQALEAISYGRYPLAEPSLVSFTIPTEGEANDGSDLDPRIIVQSGQLTGVDRVTANLGVEVSAGSLAGSTCHWNYGDGTLFDTCNPPSHTFTREGRFSVVMEMKTQRGNTLIRSVEAHVMRAEGASSGVNGLTSTQGSLTSGIDRYEVVISEVLPNPSGADTGREWAELTNLSETPAHFEGWSLVTPSGSHSLQGTVIPARSRQKIGLSALRNSDGFVRLLSPSGGVRTEILWEDAEENRIYRPSIPAGTLVRARVVQVIDGDTLKVEINDPPSVLGLDRSFSLRLIGIDAPELSQRGNAYGNEAKEFLRALIEGKEIELEFDSNTWDAYDRLLAYGYINRALIQEKILSAGLAKVYLRFPFGKQESFKSYGALAEEKKLGMWEDDISQIAFTEELDFKTATVENSKEANSTSALKKSKKSSSVKKAVKPKKLTAKVPKQSKMSKKAAQTQSLLLALKDQRAFAQPLELQDNQQSSNWSPWLILGSWIVSFSGWGVLYLQRMRRID